MLISIDGAPDWLVDKFLANGVLPANGAFARMKATGAYAERVLPVNVASTGPSHISIFTGANPGVTGIVGNSFRKNGDDFNSPALSAFRQPIAAETIFQAAMRQGKKVVTLGGVGLDNSAENRMTDNMHMYPLIAGPSLVMDMVADSSSITETASKLIFRLKTDTQSPSAAIFEMAGNGKIPLYLYQVRDRKASTENTDLPAAIIVYSDSLIDNGYSTLVQAGEWTSITIKKNGRQYNASFRILNADEQNNRYRILMTAPAEVYGHPAAFLQKLQNACGVWPGEPENRKQTAGLVPESIWFEQLDRLAAYSKRLILAGMKEENWDLLFGYFSTLDDLQHRYTLTEPRQLDYNADNRKRPQRYAGYIEKYFRLIDDYLLEIMEAAPTGTNFVVFSDHGMIPVHTCLLLNNYLESTGFKVSNREVISISSGNSAHIYVNRKQIASPGAYTQYLHRLTETLKNLRDTVTGNPVFELVAGEHEQKDLGLYHPLNSGDLFVSCKTGFSISDRYSPGVHFFVKNSFDPALFSQQDPATQNFLLTGTMNETGRAVHGCLAGIRKGQSIFYSIGPGIPQKTVNKMHSTQIAATVAALLQIKPPANAAGKAIF